MPTPCPPLQHRDTERDKRSVQRKVKKREKIAFEWEKLFPCLRSEVQPVGLWG